MSPAPRTPPARGSLLPVVASPRRPRRSRASRWRAGVLIAVHLLIALHVAHWLLAGETMTPLEPSEAMELGRSGVINAGAVFFLAAIGATALVGRFFCGWGCHLVALQDLCRFLLERVGIRPKPLRSRLLALVPLAAFFYMFLWPLTYRLLAGLGPPALTKHFTTADFYATFPGPGVAIATFVVCGFLCVYLLGAKGFCTYACPYGAIFGVADRVAPLRIRVTDACQGCGHCTAVCTSNVRVHEEVRTYGAVVDAGCMKCLDCVSVCPNDALYLGWGKPAVATRPRAARALHRCLPWREELVLALAFTATFFAFRGLYGLFPFLYSLGLAACLAYGALIGYRLATAPHVAARRLSLKRDGRLSPAGRGGVALLALAALAWAHAAGVQSQRAWGLGLERTLPAAAAQSALSPAELARARAAAGRLARALDWGVLPQPDLAPPLVRLGGRLAAGGELPAAERAFAAALAAGGPTAALLHDLGLARARQGDLAAAERLFREALALDPRALPARENLAGLLAMAGRFAEAAAEFRRAVEANPQDAQSRLLLARALAGAGRPAEARAEAEAALGLDPGSAEARELLDALPKPSGL